MNRCEFLFIAALWAAGCTAPNPAYDPNPSLPDECRSGVEVTETFVDYRRPERLDILFVVDASGNDTTGLQELLANAVTPLGALLRDLDLDVRAAVARTDGDGALARPGLSGPGCEANDAVVAELGEDDWATVLRCNLLQGAFPASFDQPLAAIDGVLGADEGFLRDDAKLLVVVATREDDCSSSTELTGEPRAACANADLLDVAELVDGWRDTADGMALAVFAGSPSALEVDDRRPVCSSTVGSAQAANRLFEATQAFDEQGYFSSVCTDDVFRPLAAMVTSFVEGTVTLCPRSELAHEPLAVSGRGDDGEDAIQWGEDGFLYLGATAWCSSGAIRFASDALRGLDEVEITYCTTDE